MTHKIAIVNSSSFGKIFPEHINRLEKIGEIKHFRFDQSIPGKDLIKISLRIKMNLY